MNNQLGEKINLFRIHEFFGFATENEMAVGYGLSESGSGIIVSLLEVFQLFLDYCIKKQNTPDIDASDFIQYYQSKQMIYLNEYLF